MSKLKLNPVCIIIEATGEQIIAGGSTKELNKVEGSDYMERLALYWSNTLGIYVAMPDEQTTLKLTA